MRNFITIIISIFVFSSCKLLSPTVMFQTEKDFEYEEFSKISKYTILQPYDVIQIQMSTNNGSILLESSMPGQSSLTSLSQGMTYMINPDSTAKVPTLGNVKLGGISKDSAETFLEQELKKYYQDPFVRITVTNRHIILFFEQGTQGRKINIPEEGISLLDAIAEAGGLTPNSKAYKIKLIRGDNTKPEVFNFNISNLEEFKKANFVLQANDIIYVDSRPQYINKIISEIQPYLVLISTAVLVYSIFTR